MNARARGRARGASMVEYMIILGVVALSALTAFTAFGKDAQGLAQKEGACVESMSCSGGPGYDGLSATSDRSAPGPAGDARSGPSGAWADASDLQPNMFDKLANLAAIDSGTLTPNPDSRLGAYAATAGHAPGTVGAAVHAGIGNIYAIFGTYGEERIGTVFNSAEAKALYDQPVESPASRQIAELEYAYWSRVLAEDGWSAGGRMGTSFDPGTRDWLQRKVLSPWW